EPDTSPSDTPAPLPPNTLTPSPLPLPLISSSPVAKATPWVFALAAAFPTLTDDVSLADVQAAWNGNGPTLLASQTTVETFTLLWGPPDNIRILSPEQLLGAAWDQRDAWALLPFQEISPRWKVIAIEGQSPLHNDFDPATYPLTALVTAPTPNYDPDKLTVVAMTGVTALVRATAFGMEQQGILYPGRDIGAWLREADITHISNEVPFARDCPYPNPVQQGVVFCSDPRYLQLLEDVGTDVVELTGDHFHDWGAEAMLYSLDLYEEKGWPVYGGGATFDEGKQASLLEHNGNKIAFIGCNGKGGSFARASATTPGSVHCDFPWLENEIARLTGEGYIVIATFQHFEYYSYDIPDVTKADFRRLAEAGAVIASGSQAHHPHGFEFVGDSLLHFGLGNLFFDQYGVSPGTEQAFIDYHVFYDGRYIGTELLTMRFEDYARAGPMTDAERRDLLLSVFGASGW
ncbi:MAG TPA: CapA family protein, partial [Anaerolineales bacterium]|nr:CapA family protein [Anaerolineales bacterium]